MSIGEAKIVPPRFVPVISVIALLAAFAFDLLTPQLLVAAILLDVPVVLSSLGGSRKFRIAIIVAALIANAIAGYLNGVQDHHHWDSIGIGDRVLSALSIALVGYLSFAVQENAQRAGRAESQEMRARREAQIAVAIERVRSSLSMELVVRAVVRESVDLLGAREARFVLSGPGGFALVARAGASAVDIIEEALPPEVRSLVARALDDGDVATIHRTDALGRLMLDTFESGAMLALPIADREHRFGVVLLFYPEDRPLDDLKLVARGYAQQAAGALAQARLFETLGERNDALEERSGVIRDLVYALSHDLRTPLAALGMTMRQARDGAYGPLPDAYRDIVNRSIIATDDVQRLAETLLLVARFESGDRRPERDRVDLVAVARQIAGELSALAAERGVHLEVTGINEAAITGDRSDIRRAITNLAANALEHTATGGHVTVAIERSGTTYDVRVSDDGYGVSEAVRAHLFARFARGDDRRGGGSGLGLYIVRRVAEESGGTVDYAANAARGSVFTLRLPAANA